MALVQCPECGGQMSTTADACPHCGYKEAKAGPAEWNPGPVHVEHQGVPSWLKITCGVLVGILLLVGIAMFATCGLTGYAVKEGMDQAKISEAEVQIENLEQSLDMYYARSSPHEYPSYLSELKVRSIVEDLPKDPWGNDFVYVRLGGGQYELFSKGKDGKRNTDDDIHSKADSN